MQKLLWVIILSIGCFFKSIAQEDQPTQDSTLQKKENHSYFKARLGYLSNNVYNGRKDSLVIPYITPTLEYFHKSGLFAKVSASYLASSYAQRIDLYQVEAGYQFMMNNSFSGSIGASKPFYNTSSVSVQSETMGMLNGGFSWDIANAISLNMTAGYIFTTGTADKFFNAALSHEFVFGKNDEWSIEPAATVNFSTQNYYEQYANNRRFKMGKIKKRKDPTITNTGNQRIVETTTITTLNANKLSMMDSELSLSLYHDAGKWSWFATPIFAIPTNAATYVTTIDTDKTLLNGITTHSSRSEFSTETISNTFYIEAGVSYRF